ncbi:hypothetical protein [Lacrimispora sp.]|uniref:hypothetical protein n=1 Tax=Lacrimispora sp. TaxID=2719234 RepID=UPI00286489C6|nr:hypothetical protein [Lacrimispora sp.]MDR7811299.1 hypothetical protein [Lacrimispora sp.]
MPRGVRKSPTEKLQQQLLNTKVEIATHKSAIKTLEEKEKQLLDELKMEELKELSDVLKENNISITDIKDIIAEKTKTV